MKLSKPTIQGTVQIPAHLSVAVATTLSSVDIDIIHDLPGNYARKLLLCTQKPWILYNDIKQRAWLVPAISLIHHMVIISQADLGLALPPFAPKSTTGKESLHVLLEHAEDVLYQYGQQKNTCCVSWSWSLLSACTGLSRFSLSVTMKSLDMT